MLLSAPEMIAKTPLNIVNYLFFADASALSLAKLAAAFAETLPITFVGLMLGRSSALTLWVTIWVTFFPAYVMLAQGLSLVPRSAMDLARAFGTSPWREMQMVSIPAALL